MWDIHTHTPDSPQGQSYPETIHQPFLHLSIAYHHFDLNRIIDNIFDLFYLINTLKGLDLSSISRTEE